MARSTLDQVVQLLIPPSLVLLLTVTIFELFYDMSNYHFYIQIFDGYVITIFAIDLYYRWKDTPKFIPYVKKHYLDIIATIPFNFIFIGVDYLVLTRGLRSVRFIARFARFARYGRLIRILRFAARAPRFMRMRKYRKANVIRKVQPHEKKMKGVLGFKVILLITVNSIMGTGIYFLTAAGAKYAGPASLISWGILALIALYISMCFGELVSMFPKAGGVYEFAKQTYGRFMSFLVGWTTTIAGNVTIAMLLLGALQYAIPTQYSEWYVPIAVGLVVLFNYIAYRGLQTSTYMLVTFAIITIMSITAIIVPGFFNFNLGNFQPFFVFPAMSIFLSIFFIAETFFGWESAIFLAAETKNPTKIMPKALIIGTIIIAIFAFLLALISMGVIPWESYGDSIRPLTDLGDVYFGKIGGIVFTILVFVSIIGAVATWIVTTPRLLMALAEDKLFFVHFAKIHPKYKSPYVSIAFQAILISFLVYMGSGSYLTLLHILIPLILVIYSVVLLSVVILRFKKPDLKRPYKAPLGIIGPFLTIAFMLFLLGMFIIETHGALDILRISGSLVAFGIPAYFFIELFYDEKFILLRRDIHARLLHFFHKLPFPSPVYLHVLSLMKPFTRKTVICDYDASVGGFTRQILKLSMHFKHVYAIDKTKQQVLYFKEKLRKKDMKKVTVLYRPTWKFPEEIPKLDVFVSLRTLGTIPDIPKFLAYLKTRLKKGGRFCFFVGYHFLDVNPNALIVEDREKIHALFKNAGLKVNYHSERRPFSRRIYVWGNR